MMAATILVAYIVCFFVLYLAYAAAWVAHKNGKLAAAPVVVRGVVYAILAVAVLTDFAFNVSVGSLIFAQLPARGRWLFTGRCAFWRFDEGWRGRFARWVCDGWLNPFQEHHC